MVFTVVQAETEIPHGGGIFIPLNAISQFGSFGDGSTFSEGYIIETLLGCISNKLGTYLQENDVLGVGVRRDVRRHRTNNIRVRSIFSVVNWISFAQKSVCVLPLPLAADMSLVGGLQLDDIFTGIRHVPPGDTISESGVLIDGDTLQKYSINYASFSGYFDNRQELASLFYIIRSILNMDTLADIGSISNFRFVDQGAISPLTFPVFVPTSPIQIVDPQFQTSMFHVSGFLWDQRFIESEETPTRQRIHNQ